MGNQTPKLVRQKATLKEIVPFGFISFVSAIFGVVILLILIGKIELLERFKMINDIYFISLIFFAITVAGVLFGIFRSYAVYSGNILKGKLELSGPIVGFFLVIIIGMWAQKSQPESFSVTIYAYGKAGKQDFVLRNKGKVWMEVENDRRGEQIGNKGEANFKALPGSFYNKEVSVWIEDNQYESQNLEKSYLLNGDNLYVQVRRKPFRFSGQVMDIKGDPIVDAKILPDGLIVGSTNTSGIFDVSIPISQEKDKIIVQVTANGYRNWQKFLDGSVANAKIYLKKR